MYHLDCPKNFRRYFKMQKLLNRLEKTPIGGVLTQKLTDELSATFTRNTDAKTLIFIVCIRDKKKDFEKFEFDLNNDKLFSLLCGSIYRFYNN